MSQDNVQKLIDEGLLNENRLTSHLRTKIDLLSTEEVNAIVSAKDKLEWETHLHGDEGDDDTKPNWL